MKLDVKFRDDPQCQNEALFQNLNSMKLDPVVNKENVIVSVAEILVNDKCAQKKLRLKYTGIKGKLLLHLPKFFFFCQGFPSHTLTIHRTAEEGRGLSFISLYHVHPLTNIETFICNFECEVTITYF